MAFALRSLNVSIKLIVVPAAGIDYHYPTMDSDTIQVECIAVERSQNELAWPLSHDPSGQERVLAIEPKAVVDVDNVASTKRSNKLESIVGYCTAVY